MTSVLVRQIISVVRSHSRESICNTINAFQRCHISTTPSLLGTNKYAPIGIPVLPEKYTLRPQPFIKTGGRGKDGKVAVKTRGGGHKKRFRMVDFKRTGPKEGPPKLEKVTEVLYDPCRSANIAVVASGNDKRYIIATENMKPGDIIKTSEEIPRLSVQPSEGDAHPLGALPLGTLVHNIERFPGEGGTFCKAAGSSAQYLRRIGEKCVLRLPSKVEITVSMHCMAVVGIVSNVLHNTIPIGSPGRLRRLGYRPRSGYKQKKTGYHGRKISNTTKTKVYDKPKPPGPKVYRLAMD